MFRMKSLRLGNFRTILEMLGPDGRSEDESTKPPAAGERLRSSRADAFKDKLGRIPDDRRATSYVPLERLARLYSEARTPEKPPDIAPANDDMVAAELRLSQAKTVEQLRLLRRSFAMRNHPDRVPDWLRNEATRRMCIANALIDIAMRDRARKRGRG